MPPNSDAVCSPATAAQPEAPEIPERELPEREMKGHGIGIYAVAVVVSLVTAVLLAGLFIVLLVSIGSMQLNFEPVTLKADLTEHSAAIREVNKIAEQHVTSVVQLASSAGTPPPVAIPQPSPPEATLPSPATPASPAAPPAAPPPSKPPRIPPPRPPHPMAPIYTASLTATGLTGLADQGGFAMHSNLNCWPSHGAEDIERSGEDADAETTEEVCRLEKGNVYWLSSRLKPVMLASSGRCEGSVLLPASGGMVVVPSPTRSGPHPANRNSTLLVQY